MIRRVVLALLLAMPALLAQVYESRNPPPPSSGTLAAKARLPFVDTHVHLEPGDPAGSVQATLDAMPAENAARILFMPPPFAAGDSGRYDIELFLAAVKGHEDSFEILGGGGSLNVLIQESAHSRDASPELRRRFKEQAEELLRLGAAGFGELAAEHFQGATAYQSVPPDHPLFLLLADIAAEHGVPIVLHMEAVPRGITSHASSASGPLHPNLGAFERLLTHNRRARIVWAHAGWDNTGYRTPEVCRRLLRRNPNLYMDVKIDPLRPGKNSPLAGGASGGIRADWLMLFRDFPDRFLVGTDQHYPMPPSGPQRWEAAVRLLDQLPDNIRQMVAVENASRLFPLRPRSGQ